MAWSCSLLLFVLVPVAARAAESTERPIDVSISYTADLSLSGDRERDAQGYYLGNLDAIADADLDRLVHWRGAQAHLYLLANHGGRPNDRTMTLEGINNIEVPRPGVRLFEAWLEQRIGSRASLRLGLYDLNSEFYVTEASDLLVAPPFGIGSELAVSGPNGPSTFPSSALAVRARFALGRTGQAQLAVLNADARTLGDDGGVDLSFRQGVLVIGELARGERVRWTLGGWFYTRDMPVIDADRPMDRATSFGGYAMLQWRLNGAEGSRASYVFARAGLSDGVTSPVAASIQLGLFVRQPFASRPDSALSIGLHRGWRSSAYHSVALDGRAPRRRETGIEFTYSDQLIPHVTLQPDLQLVINPGAEVARPVAVVAQLRTIIGF